MKILIACGYPAHYIRRFHEALLGEYGLGLRFLYVQRSPGEVDRRYERGNLPAGALTIPSETRVWGLFKLLNHENPDVVVCAGHFPRQLGWVLLWAGLRRRRVVYWCDTNLMDVLRKGRIRRLLVTAGLWFLSIFIVERFAYVGSRGRDFYLWALGEKAASKLRHLPYPAILSRRNSGSWDPRFFNVLYLGRLAPEKCVGNLIRALAQMPVHMLELVRLTIAGDGPERVCLEALSRRLDIGTRVRFVGSVASDMTADFYAMADFLVLPSRFEPWGLVVNEALSAGTPVICPYWVGAAADLVIDGVTGLVLPDNSPQAIARGIERALRSRGRLRAMGTAGRRLVEQGGWNLAGAVQRFGEIISDIGALP